MTKGRASKFARESILTPAQSSPLPQKTIRKLRQSSTEQSYPLPSSSISKNSLYHTNCRASLVSPARFGYALRDGRLAGNTRGDQLAPNGFIPGYGCDLPGLSIKACRRVELALTKARHPQSASFSNRHTRGFCGWLTRPTGHTSRANTNVTVEPSNSSASPRPVTEPCNIRRPAFAQEPGHAQDSTQTLHEGDFEICHFAYHRSSLRTASHYVRQSKPCQNGLNFASGPGYRQATWINRSAPEPMTAQIERAIPRAISI